jgi:hypothetical protein
MNDKQSNLALSLLSIYGPVISGEKLYAALGFRTYGAFRSAKERGEMPVEVFKMPNRRDWHARTSDIADWLTNVNQSNELISEGRDA